jgi:hypothetical protein
VYNYFYLFLHVTATVDRVFVVGGLAAAAVVVDTNVTRSSPSSSSIRVVEGHPSRLRCMALGGYPPPSVDVHVGHRDITTHLSFSNLATLSPGGLPGMRLIYFRSERSTDSFQLTADDDGSLLRCIVIVPGFSPFVETVRLDVDCKN